jgi:ABC-2 type transport system permease protein
MAHVLSYIPFTAPITTSIRVPFAGEIPGFALQWTLSALSAVLCFLGTTWISAKIYEVGILLYGQKVGYAQIFSWLRRK